MEIWLPEFFNHHQSKHSAPKGRFFVADLHCSTPDLAGGARERSAVQVSLLRKTGGQRFFELPNALFIMRYMPTCVLEICKLISENMSKTPNAPGSY
jgi:hypothetical protein